MNETYRKTGRSVRFMILADASETLIHSEEGGMAELSGRRFTCRAELPLEVPALSIEPEEIREVGVRLQAAMVAPVEIERLTITHGSTRHAITRDDTLINWTEQSVRAVVSLVNRARGVRCVMQTGGGPQVSDLRFEEIERVSRCLGGFERREVKSGAVTIRFAPGVAASLWPFLIQGSGRRVSNVSIWQDTHPDTPLDGAGREIVPFEIQGQTLSNVYRPSYRRPAYPAAFHLRVKGLEASAQGEWRAVAALSSPRREGNMLTVGLLCTNADDDASFGFQVAMPVQAWMQGIRSVGEGAIWYPYDAGSYGSETVIEVHGK